MTCGALSADLSTAVNGVVPSDATTRVVTPFGDEIGLVSVRDEPNYTVTSLGDRIPTGSISFDQSDRDLNQTEFEGYQRNATDGTVQFLIFDTPLIDNQPLLYARYLQATFELTADDLLRIRCGLGVPTLSDDLPNEPIEKAAARFFTLSLAFSPSRTSSQSVGYDLNPSLVAFNFDPAGSAVSIDLTVRGQEILADGLSPVVEDLGDFSATGSFDEEVTNFGGIITDNDDVEVGNFEGWFFGPQGAEVAISYIIRQDSSFRLNSRGVIFLR